MAKADAEIEAHFVLSNEEFSISREWDRKATLEAMLPEQRRRSESKRRYRAANKEKVAESQRRYYAANKEKVAESKQTLKAARAAAGLTQTQAAEILGVRQSTISFWENIVPPNNWKEIVEIISAKGKAPASAGTETSASQI